jgi:hypothetical protein
MKALTPLLIALLFVACERPIEEAPPVVEEAPASNEEAPPVEEVAEEAPVEAPATDCSGAKNTCPDYDPSWSEACPEGVRCIQFKNSCDKEVILSYQIGCNGDGTSGAPQCNCSEGPSIQAGKAIHWKITDGDYTSCLPSWTPPCLTAGLAVMANQKVPDCSKGTRVEFSAGNKADPYGKFDSYNISTQDGKWYSIPVNVRPDLECAVDHGNNDCRPLWCNSPKCPDAYSDPTSGGCPDGRSPQGGCQDTFGQSKGYLVEFCPASCSTTGGDCPSCQEATPCQ